MEIKKTNNAQLEDKRLTFFLIGLLIAFTFLFVGLQYQKGPQGEDDMTEDFEDLAQDLDMQMPPDQKDMVSAEAMTKAPASEAITQEVKPTEQQQVQQAPEKISTTTSQLVIGDGSGVVEGADVKEAAPETVVDNTSAQEPPIKFTVVQKIPEFPGGWSAFMQWLTKNLKYPESEKKNRIQGTVRVTFIVNKDGSIASTKVSTSADPVLDAEALRGMKMMPKWKPGMDHNKICRTMIAVPVVFKL